MSRGRWRALLPEPFWSTLIALLVLSVFTAIPLEVICALIWPNAAGLAVALIFAGCYLAAVPLTWWMFRSRWRR